jgi:hypothetical protein
MRASALTLQPLPRPHELRLPSPNTASHAAGIRANLSSTGAYLRQISTDVSVFVEHVASSVSVCNTVMQYTGVAYVYSKGEEC